MPREDNDIEQRLADLPLAQLGPDRDAQLLAALCAAQAGRQVATAHSHTAPGRPRMFLRATIPLWAAACVALAAGSAGYFAAHWTRPNIETPRNGRAASPAASPQEIPEAAVHQVELRIAAALFARAGGEPLRPEDWRAR